MTIQFNITLPEYSRGYHLITNLIENELKELPESGIINLFIKHTSAGLSINENADPSVKQDLLMALGRAVPDELPYRHSEGNSPAHVKASLMGSSISVIIEENRLRLGTWQGIFFCEFDGPRHRRFFVHICD